MSASCPIQGCVRRPLRAQVMAERRLVVEARRGTAPPRRGALWFPAEDQTYRPVEPLTTPVAPPVEGVA